MNHIPDTVENFLLNVLDYEADIILVSYNAPNSTVSVHDVKHLRPGLIVNFSGFPYPVISVDHTANTFVVAGDVSAETVASLPKPYFFHGTQMSVNKELSRIKEEQKVPLVWLYETIEASGEASGSDGNPKYMTANLRIFFLDSANYGDWGTNEYYEEVHTPQMKLAQYFFWMAGEKPYKGLDPQGTFRYRLYGPFGTQTERGSLDSIFNEHLAGVELNATFRVKDCQPNKSLNIERPPDQIEGLQSPLQAALLG